MKKIIYADNAATTKIDMNAYEAMQPYLLTEYGNPSQYYTFSKSSRLAIKGARKLIAQCINASDREIFFTSGGTESDNWALKGVVLRDNSPKRILISAIEHHAIINVANKLKKLGHKVDVIPVDHEGKIDFEKYVSMFNNKVDLVSIMLANNEIGTIQDIAKLSKVAHEKGAIFHTDAVQGVGHICIDVRKLDIDLLSSSAHKFNGPKGVGFIYVKEGTCIDAFHDGGAQELGYRAGTENVASIVAMATALENNVKNIDINYRHCLKLEKIIINKLLDNKINFIVNGSSDKLPGLLSLSFANMEGELVLHRMDLMGICVSTGSACDSVNTKLSHVIEAINVDSKYAVGTIRVSLSKNNTEYEAEKIADALIKIVAK